MGIAAAAVIAQWFHAGNADRGFGLSFAPGTPEAVGDDDGDRMARAFFEFSMQLFGGAVWIFGEQQGVAASANIRDVDAAVGTDESVMGFGDEHAVLAANDGAAFAQGKFDDSGIEVVFLGPGYGVR